MSDSDEENVIKYGTPLEPFDEDEVPSKKKFQQKAADQYAVDDHGRRRFHGAFTGGFSAGFGNTVDTPEGFTPATFRSSRSERNKISNQRPEDFMDEEDRSEFGIAPRQMQTHSDFSGQKTVRQTRFHDGPIPGEPVLENILRPVHETAAVKILRAMGWRPGQGTGSRMTAKQKKDSNTRKKVYGCQLPTEAENDDSGNDSYDSEFEYENLFAPDDYEAYILRHKNDRFGLGYSGLSRHSVLGNMSGEYGSADNRSHLIFKDKGKKVSIRGQAFGVGALEEDDEDIYASEDMSHYDFALGGPSREKAKPVVKTSKGVLEGFVKASKPLPSVPNYPPPTLPRSYKPSPAGHKRSRFESTDIVPRDQGLGRHELSANARGELLGETPIPKPSDTPTTHIETNKQNETTNTHTDKPRTLDFVPPSTELEYIPISNAAKLSTNPNVFKPFASNPEKQSRYEDYLRDKGNTVKRDGVMDRLTAWERDRELVEFEQAAKLYKPLAGVMGDRFTHATEPDDQPTNPLAAVSRSKNNHGLATKEQMEAAAQGCFGVMTRTRAEWRPERMVCVRFNVPDPFGSRQEPKKDDRPKISYSIFDYMESSVHNKESFTKEQTTFSGSKSTREPIPSTSITQPIVPENPNKRLTVADMFMKEFESETQEKQEIIDKFDKMELYKSIFLSDSEEDEKDVTDAPKNVERNKSPPRGIFANIDFDELNSWNKNTEKPKEIIELEKPKAIIEPEKPVPVNEEKTDMYGPKIPENLMKRLQETEEPVFKPIFTGKRKFGVDSVSSNKVHEWVTVVVESSDDSWVEAEPKAKKSKKKKSKKHKKHKKSHKKDK